MRVGIWNPLPQVLHHFEQSLTVLLGELDGISAVRLDAVPIEMEPDASMLDRVARMAQMVKDVATVVRRKKVDVVINLWPALGFVDIPVWSLSGVRSYTIVHDPSPLRKQFGVDPRLGPLSNLPWIRDRSSVIVHTNYARDAALKAGLRDPIVLPLPALPPKFTRAVEPGPVTVLGQYKPARDIELLKSLGTVFADRGIAGLIVGRGWPATPGWDAVDRFVEEEEFDNFVQSAACVLIPYKDYYQSDVAIRAFERGTPVVGHRHEFLELQVGADWPGFTATNDADDWIEAIERVRSIDSDQMLSAIEEGRRHARKQWGEFLSRQ